MRQGVKSIIGLWKYNQNAIYEKGDFVIKGENIYRVNEEVQGLDPDEDLTNGKYELYPGKRVTTKEEYETIVNNSDITNDQYISSSALNSILKSIYFGLDSDGIIDTSINVTPENSIETSSSLSLIPSEDILDQLLDAPGYNNGTIKVSKNLKGIKDLVGHPDETEYIKRGSDKWIVCDRERCKKCWECVRVCERLKKTVNNDLIINNGTSSTDCDDILPVESDSFEHAVNICPYRALSFTSDPEQAKEESVRYEQESSGHAEIPGRDLIIFGAKTYEVQGTSETTTRQLVITNSEYSQKSLIGIYLNYYPAAHNTTKTNMVYEKIETIRRQKRLDDNILKWYITPGGEISEETTSTTITLARSSQYVKGVETTSAEYDRGVNGKAICVFSFDGGTIDPGNQQLIDNFIADLIVEIDYNLRTYNNQNTDNFDWKIMLGIDDGSESPKQVEGTESSRIDYYEYQDVPDTITTTETVSYSNKLCAMIDCMETMCKIVAGDGYNSSRITQSERTSTNTGAGVYDWELGKTRSYPSNWTTTLYPDNNLRHLNEYPIGNYWDWWCGVDKEGYELKNLFYSSKMNISSTTKDYLVASFYNLAGNMFCVKVPESCLKFFAAVQDDTLRTQIETELTPILTRGGFTSTEASTIIINKFLSGLYSSITDLSNDLSSIAYCDFNFNITFGRYFKNDYISGTSEFIASVEDKITNSQYYNQLDQFESAMGSAGVFDMYTVCTTKEEWKNGYAVGRFDSLHVEDPTSADGPGLALLPRMLYSEWTSLINSLNEEGDNKSNLLIVPRWMSSSNYSTLVRKSQTYTVFNEHPFWDQLHDRESEEELIRASIDSNVRYIADYFKKNFFVSSADSYAILKQYSYYGNTGTLLRVQELIDPEYGEMYVRSTKSRDWKPCVVNDKNVIRKLTRLYSTLDSFRQRNTEGVHVTTSTYGTSSLSTWTKNRGWGLQEAINDRNYYVRNNIGPEVFILLVKAPNGKLYNVTVYTSRNSVDTVYTISPDVTISVKYSDNMNRVYIICSYGVDLEDIYYGK